MIVVEEIVLVIMIVLVVMVVVVLLVIVLAGSNGKENSGESKQTSTILVSALTDTIMVTYLIL